MAIHANIRQLRKQKGMTSKYVAAQLNLTPAAYSMKESGKRPFTLKEIEQLAITIGVEVADFFVAKINKMRKGKTA
ncbi:helix-turn-helix domain-containing protein [Brevibacillus marinus]|uniref:helix-turn-helix domain-containing protein n=1 Tax=Brevibacillus marinus TaxID=2496837 RepID=UPI000F84E555|nr:helix-turn-helix transcriptional regulator [Brevibacillus marinus]